MTQTKPNVPGIDSMRALHKGYATTLDPQDRVEYMRGMVNWYTENAPFQGPQVFGAKDYNRACGASELGMRADTPYHEADNSLRFAIRMLEKIYANVPIAGKIPKFEDTEKALKENLPHLEYLEKKRRAEFEPYLKAMNDVFSAVGITYDAKVQDRNRMVGVDKKIRVSETYARDRVKALDKDLVPLLLEEIPAVVRALSLGHNETGAIFVDGNLVNTNMGLVMETVAKKVRVGIKIETVAIPTPVAAPPPVTFHTTTAVPATPRAPRPASQGGTLFRAGTFTAEIYDRLIKACGTGKSCTISETVLLANIASGDPSALINDVATKGRKTGAFTLTRSRHSMQLNFTNHQP